MVGAIPTKESMPRAQRFHFDSNDGAGGAAVHETIHVRRKNMLAKERSMIADLGYRKVSVLLSEGMSLVRANRSYAHEGRDCTLQSFPRVLLYDLLAHGRKM